MTLNKTDLDFAAAAGCQTPGCRHDHEATIFLHGRCHPFSHVAASYTKGTGVLRVVCCVCQQPIAEVKVSEQ